ncbi:MAG: DUF2752 domain-containing protein [Chitinophagales bacterium]
MLPCLVKKYTGNDCPTCGTQRAVYMFFSGDFKQAILFYPPLLPLLMTFFFSLLFIIKPGSKNRILFFSSVGLYLISILTFYFLP